MFMMDITKKEVKSTLIIQFIQNIKKPQYFEIINLKKEVPENSDEIKIDFSDSNINKYNIYTCKTKYKDKVVLNSLSIYYDKINYFNCGDGDHSAEIIFSDFLNKSIKGEDCVIEYDGVKYYPKEDFGLLTRKRINFINIDIHKFKFPKDLNDKEINIDTKDNKNFLISISIIDKPKIIAIYLNNPHIDVFNLNDTSKEVLQILNSTLECIKKIVYIEKNEQFEKFVERGNENIFNEYLEEINKSFEIEKRISNYFLIPREKLDEEQIEIYDKYCEFMIYYPYTIISLRQSKDYYYQYYFSKNCINNFIDEIPKDFDSSVKMKLKYAAIKCLKILLNAGNGWFLNGIFEFLDLTKIDSIYDAANLYNKKFITCLTEKSEIFIYFLQVYSGCSTNLLSNELFTRISMLDEKTIKAHLISKIPKFLINVLVNNSDKTFIVNEVDIACINFENRYQDLPCIMDYFCDRRFILANLLLHVYLDKLNYIKNTTPHKDYMIKDKKEEIQEIVREKTYCGKIILKGDAGLALNFFLTRGKYQLMKLIRKNGIIFRELFAIPEILAAEDLSEFINKLNKLYLENTSRFNCDEDCNIEYTTRFKEYKTHFIPCGFPRLKICD